MEDTKDDNKDNKSINFHQMELDDRILKVRNFNILKILIVNIPMLSGNC